MAFDISKFSAHLNKYGTIKNNRYEVIISPPRFFDSSNYKEVFGLMPLRAETVNIPDINLNLLDVNRYGIGPKQRFPTNIQYPETISITFLETEESDIHKFFTIWSSAIFGHINPIDYNRRGFYLTEYKTDYSSTIQIKVYTDTGEDYISNIVELTEAYPSQISVSALGWGEMNNLIRVNVNFVFTDIRFPLLNPRNIPVNPTKPIILP
jgi:hypothetical protein